jgi:hypothetical protein
MHPSARLFQFVSNRYLRRPQPSGKSRHVYILQGAHVLIPAPGG